MKKKLSICLFLGFLMTTPLVIFAQDDATTEPAEPTFSITGSVDTYFHTQIGTEDVAPATAFANHRGFALGMANVIAAYDGDKAGFKADLVFGPRGTDAVFNSPYTSSEIVNQLYAYWKPTESLTLTLGNFNTYIGYEVISPTVNVNYSTSYMFSYGPFSHTGLKANLEFGTGMNVMLAVMDPTDWTEFQPVNTYTLGAQFGYSGDAGGLWLNLLYGDQDGTLKEFNFDRDGDGVPDDYSMGATFQADLTTGWTLSDNLYLGFNATFNSTAPGEILSGSTISDAPGDPGSFIGFALYPKITMSESSVVAFRAEYFSVKNYYLSAFGLDSKGDGSVIDLTLSLNEKVGNLTLIPEIRVDMASEDSWYKSYSEGETPSTTKTMPTFNLAAVYSF